MGGGRWGNPTISISTLNVIYLGGDGRETIFTSSDLSSLGDDTLSSTYNNKERKATVLQKERGGSARQVGETLGGSICALLRITTAASSPQHVASAPAFCAQHSVQQHFVQQHSVPKKVLQFEDTLCSQLLFKISTSSPGKDHHRL